LGLSQLPDDPERFPAVRRVRNLLAEGIQFTDLLVGDLCKSVPPDASAHLNATGEGVPAVVHALEVGPKDRYAEWLNHVSEAIPGIEAIRSIEADGQRKVMAQMRGGIELPIQRLSHGSILALGLALLPYQDRRDAIVIIEAPESGIHPRSIEPLAQALATDSSTQIMLTTYSPLWVGAVSGDRLRRFVRDAGAIRVLPGLEVQGDTDQVVDVPVLFSAGLL
jgi:predicted ATPase